MNFTNTYSVREDIYWDLDGQLWDQFNYEVWNQVNNQVNWKVYDQINLIKNKIRREINK
jgi:hypothetical protein